MFSVRGEAVRVHKVAEYSRFEGVDESVQTNRANCRSHQSTERVLESIERNQRCQYLCIHFLLTVILLFNYFSNRSSIKVSVNVSKIYSFVSVLANCAILCCFNNKVGLLLLLKYLPFY